MDAGYLRRFLTIKGLAPQFSSHYALGKSLISFLGFKMGIVVPALFHHKVF